jgi:integral membrane protein (TIGR01906 family)
MTVTTQAAVPETIERDSLHWLMRVCSIYLALAIPVLLVLFSVRMVMTESFLRFEYTRSNFPADPYGLTLNDRLLYAPYAVDYLLNDADISYLGDLRFDDGRALYNARELHHMRDVKAVTQAAFNVGIIGALLAISAAIFLRVRDSSRRWLRASLRSGALLTLSLIFTIVVLAVVGWDFFFTAFHQVFFADGTWTFAYSDTLIRLFPEQFWFDAALAIGAITVGGALLILLALAFNRRLLDQAADLTDVNTNARDTR